MVGEALQDWRRERMRALAKKMGGNAPLGRALGYSDGAFVGQMVSGIRPISEKTIEAAEKLQGARGWFKPQDEPAAAPAASKELVFEELRPEEKAFLEDYRALTDSERQRLAAEVATRAAELREYLQQHSTAAVPLVARQRHAAALRPVGEKATTQPRPAADPNQTALPLEQEGKR